MARVKFNVNTEYAYIQNFKILQSTSYCCYLAAAVQANLPFRRRLLHKTLHRSNRAS